MIDEIDWKLLYELQADARTSYAELGRRIGLTAGNGEHLERAAEVQNLHLVGQQDGEFAGHAFLSTGSGSSAGIPWP